VIETVKSSEFSPANPHRSFRLSIQRSFIWSVVFSSYGALACVAWSWITGAPIGAAGLGLYIAIFVGTPCLVGHAGYLWRKNLLHGATRFEAAICIVFPISVLGLGAVALLLGR